MPIIPTNVTLIRAKMLLDTLGNAFFAACVKRDANILPNVNR